MRSQCIVSVLSLAKAGSESFDTDPAYFVNIRRFRSKVMRQERHVNNTQSVLDGTITSVATSLTLTDGSGFPSEGDFRLLIEEELLLATARSSNVLTVERGIEGTTPAEHISGKIVRVIVTEGALEQFWSDFDPFYVPNATPPSRIFDASGDVIGHAGFTWYNQGTATVEDLADGSILLTTPAGADNQLRGKWMAAPSTPYVLTVAVAGLWLQSALDYPQCGITVENSGDGKLVCIVLHWRVGMFPAIQIMKLNSYTSFDSSFLSPTEAAMPSELAWLRFADNGTNHTFSISLDGVNWLQIYTGSRTLWLSNGGDRIGFGHDRAGNDAYGINHFTYIKHWSLS